jgi:hypothetical protein
MNLLEKSKWPYQADKCMDFLINQSLINLETAFDLALYCSCLSLVKSDDKKDLLGKITELIELQLPDGSWCDAPVLRLTNNDCKTPWIEQNSGELFSDRQRLFTTATVLNSLSAVLKKLTST